ncbi:hypothetical protein [Kitasatospora paranensis]|uniref:Peptidase inhibitor family I36 n=1 Tax=Kitasatospora paranensis TaxID=258053 RepID=A0ABW2FV43_9ACTN
MKLSPSKSRRGVRAAVLATVAAAASLATALPAFAEAPAANDDNDSYYSSEKCAAHSDWFRFRLFYNSGYQGAWVNAGHGIGNFDALQTNNGVKALTFCSGTGNGAGQNVKNNTASVYNYGGHLVVVSVNSWSHGDTDAFYPNTGGNLVATYNNNASMAVYE